MLQAALQEPREGGARRELARAAAQIVVERARDVRRARAARARGSRASISPP
jgi:hypothetical protein